MEYTAVPAPLAQVEQSCQFVMDSILMTVTGVAAFANVPALRTKISAIKRVSGVLIGSPVVA
jgi:hypothetical protein